MITDNEAWVRQTRDLLTKLVTSLKEGITSLKKCLKIKGIVDEDDEETGIHIDGSASEISNSIEQMQVVLRRLDALKLRVDDFSAHVSWLCCSSRFLLPLTTRSVDNARCC